MIDINQSEFFIINNYEIFNLHSHFSRINHNRSI